MSHERSTVSNHFIQIVTKDLSGHCQLLIIIRDFVYLYLPMEIPTHWGKTVLRSTKHFDFDAIVRRFSSFHSEIVTAEETRPSICGDGRHRLRQFSRRETPGLHADA